MPGLPAITVPGIDPGCEHRWGEYTTKARKKTSHSDAVHKPGYKALFRSSEWVDHKVDETPQSGQFCLNCGGWRGSLGLEPTIEMFVGHIVLVWRELWRVLADDGTCWLNIGDSYAGGGQGNYGNKIAPEHGQHPTNVKNKGGWLKQNSLKPKDLMGIPWRVAFALQADGWYLRSDIIWAKGVSFNPVYSGSVMPGSQKDRPTTAHEYVFLLAKSKKYYYDIDAVREPSISSQATDRIIDGKKSNVRYSSVEGGVATGSRMGNPESGMRNIRTVWTINTKPYPEAHFATFCPELVSPMILAGTSEKGKCANCGKPYLRITKPTVEYAEMLGRDWADYEQDAIEGRGHSVSSQRPQKRGESTTASYETVGWEATCDCQADVVKDVVLDPFLGSGTTCMVAEQKGRDSIGVELNPEYAKMAYNRIKGDSPMFNIVTLEGIEDD